MAYSCPHCQAWNPDPEGEVPEAILCQGCGLPFPSEDNDSSKDTVPISDVDLPLVDPKAVTSISDPIPKVVREEWGSEADEDQDTQAIDEVPPAGPSREEEAREKQFSEVRTAVLDVDGLKKQLEAMTAEEPETKPGESEPLPVKRATSEVGNGPPLSDVAEAKKTRSAAPREGASPRRRDISSIGFDDIPTDVISAAQLREQLSEMKKEEAAAARGPGGDSELPSDSAPEGVVGRVTEVAVPLDARVRFPQEELVRWLDGRRRAWSKSSALFKLLTLLLVSVPIAVAAGIFLWYLLAYDSASYLRGREPLRTGPGGAEEFQTIATLERGSRIATFDRVGPYVLVREHRGLAGYVLARALAGSRPATDPGYPFADCDPSSFDPAPDSCVGRAQAQLASCRAVCASRADGASCLERCQGRFEDCTRACEGEPPGTQASPELQEPDQVAETPPRKAAAESAESDPAAPARPAKVPKTSKKKRRKKRKR